MLVIMKKKIKSNEPSEYGIMGNISNYTFDVYFVIMTIIISILLILIGHAYKTNKYLIVIKKNKKYKLSKILFIIMKKILLINKTKQKLISLLILSSYFLLITPFLLLFKTNQVVNERPFIINNYKKIIQTNSTILYTSIAFNETLFLLPSDFDIKTNNIVNKFWHQFKFTGKLYDMSTTMGLDVIENLKNLLIHGKTVFISEFFTVTTVKAVLCSFTNENELIQIFIHHDNNQRSQIQGIPVRRGFFNKQLNIKHRRLFEMNIFRQILNQGVEYMGFTFLVTSKEHRRIQYEYCTIQQPIEFKTKDDIAPSRFQFFSLLFFTLFSVYGLAFVIFIIEFNYILIKKFIHRL